MVWVVLNVFTYTGVLSWGMKHCFLHLAVGWERDRGVRQTLAD